MTADCPGPENAVHCDTAAAMKPIEYRLATEAEIKQAREQKREMNMLAREAVRARGVKLHPRIAAMELAREPE